MNTYNVVFKGRLISRAEINVAAKTFTEAVKKTKQVARTGRYYNTRRPEIISLVRTATLNA